jgi:chorismate mutase-like protein
MKERNQEDIRKSLKPFRHQIDALDDKIVALLGERFDIVRKVAKIKAENDFPSYISDRVVQVRERNAKTGKKYGIDPEFVKMLYSLIIYQSCAVEDVIKYDLKERKKKKAAKGK